MKRLMFWFGLGLYSVSATVLAAINQQYWVFVFCLVVHVVCSAKCFYWVPDTKK